MSILTFHYNRNLIYAIIYWVLEIINRIIMYFYWDYFQIIKEDSINEYLYVLMLNISDLLAGFLVLYINFSLKKKKSFKEISINDKNSSNSKKNLIFGAGNKALKSKNFIYKIILICFLDYINRAAFYIFYQIFEDAVHDDISDKAQKDIIIHIDILARYVFSIIILKTKIFKHHKLAIIIILIGFFILFPTDIISIHFFTTENINKYTFGYIGILSITGILYPLEDTLIKKVFTDFYIIPETLMFIRGLGEFVLILIVTPFLYFFVWVYDKNAFFSASLTSIVLMIIFYILTSFVKAYLIMKIIYYFSSQSVSFLIISETITSSVSNIIKYFISGDNYNNYKGYYFIILLIEIIVIFNSLTATLIYDEIIVIKKWGLEKDVAKEISERSVLELSTMKLVDDNNEEEEHDE